MKRFVTAIALSTAMALAPVAASAAGSQQGALAPGDSAGVKQAQMWDGHHWGYWLLGAAVVAGAIILVSNNSSHHHSTNNTTGAP
jgi:hypothetical protein